jgi:hypothetical protein
MSLNIRQIKKNIKFQFLTLTRPVSLAYYFEEVSFLSGELTNLTTVTNDVFADPLIYTVALTW